MACSEYNQLVEALEQYAFRDAVVCSYGSQMPTVVFATFVLVGMVNIPIYLRQDSALIPVVITMLIGGVWVSQVASMVQGLIVFVILMILGVGPVLVLRRLQI